MRPGASVAATRRPGDALVLINRDERELPRAGKHRSTTRRHRPAHQGEYASLLARFVPAWTIRPSPSRPPAHPDRDSYAAAATRVDRHEPAIELDLTDNTEGPRLFDLDEVDGLILAPATGPAQVEIGRAHV